MATNQLTYCANQSEKRKKSRNDKTTANQPEWGLSQVLHLSCPQPVKCIMGCTQLCSMSIKTPKLLLQAWCRLPAVTAKNNNLVLILQLRQQPKKKNKHLKQTQKTVKVLSRGFIFTAAKFPKWYNQHHTVVPGTSKEHFCIQLCTPAHSKSIHDMQKTDSNSAGL